MVITRQYLKIKRQDNCKTRQHNTIEHNTTQGRTGQDKRQRTKGRQANATTKPREKGKTCKIPVYIFWCGKKEEMGKTKQNKQNFQPILTKRD
jgi:hypothetical protein